MNIDRAANSQKDAFRRDPDSPEVNSSIHQPILTLPHTYIIPTPYRSLT